MTTMSSLGEVAAAASRLLKEVGASAPPAGGSLTVVGTGIRAVTQLTLEAVAEMAAAEVLLHVIGEPVQEEVVQSLNPAARTLTGHYKDGQERGATYEAMVEEILAAVTAGRRTVAAFYGHPGVFTYPSHESVRRARALGYPARMLPAVSAEGCMWADLGLDPGDGCQCYEATDYLFRQQRTDPASFLVLWQVGSIGNYTYEANGYDLAALPGLVAKLRRTYPAGHVVTVYEASFAPGGWARVLRVPLGRLDAAMVTPATTLLVPPLAAVRRASDRLALAAQAG
jgi:hypothetical protein